MDKSNFPAQAMLLGEFMDEIHEIETEYMQRIRDTQGPLAYLPRRAKTVQERERRVNRAVAIMGQITRKRTEIDMIIREWSHDRCKLDLETDDDTEIPLQLASTLQDEANEYRNVSNQTLQEFAVFLRSLDS